MTGVADASFACAAALVDALVAGGVRHACVSPGSRSTPLALAIARDGRLTAHVHLDERSAAFFALGLAKATGDPVALACTSGTAAAEYFPAVVEASQARTPLVILTADRPPRLRGTGANQTIDQVDLYGRYARAYLEPPVPGDAGDAEAWRDTGARALESARALPPGPVHVNCCFDEPVVPSNGAAAGAPVRAPAAPGAGPDRGNSEEARSAVDAFVETYAGRPGVITVGGLPAPQTLSLLGLGRVLGWPVLAEPTSGLRLDASDAGRALAAGLFVIGDAGWLEPHRPEVVLQAGAAPTTRATQALVAGTEALLVLDRDHLDPDPGHRARQRILVDPELFAATAWEAYAGTPPQQPDGWQEEWRAADLLARATVDRLLDTFDEPFEGRVARDLGSFLPNGATLFVGSSSPIRDLDAYLAPRRPPRLWNPGDLLRVIANRGASGIDGAVATALGVAAGGGRPTYALLGELTFLVDAGSLLWSARRGHDAVFVVLANGGGQIFAQLEQGRLPELEELFLTPHPVEVAALCAATGTPHQQVRRAAELAPALARAAREGGVQVVEVVIDPALQHDRRAAIRAAIAETLAAR